MFLDLGVRKQEHIFINILQIVGIFVYQVPKPPYYGRIILVAKGPDGDNVEYELTKKQMDNLLEMTNSCQPSVKSD